MHTSEKHPHLKNPRIYIKFQFKEQEQLFPVLHLPLWLPRGSSFMPCGRDTHPPFTARLPIHLPSLHKHPSYCRAWNRLHTSVLLLCFTAVAFPTDCAWGSCPSFILDPWKYPSHCTALLLPPHCTLISIIFRDKGHKVGSWTTDTNQWERLLMQDGSGRSSGVRKHLLTEFWELALSHHSVIPKLQIKHTISHFNPTCCTASALLKFNYLCK